VKSVAFILAALVSFSAIDSIHGSERKLLHHHCPTESYDHKLVIDLLAVGQGDSTFIRTPNGTTVLIDGGNPGRGYQDVLPTLRKCYSVKSLDYVVLTHPHADHFGGLIDVLKEMPVKKAIYDTGDSGGTAFGKYAALANGSGKRKIPELGDKTIVGDDAVHFQIVAVDGHVLGGKTVSVFEEDGSPIDKNSVSIAMEISFGNFRYFTGGDLTGSGGKHPDVESAVADVVGPVDVMKADHHGSATANNEHLLRKLKPRQILISVGDGEPNRRYHLPNSGTMARLMSLSYLEEVFQTARGEGRSAAAILKKVHNENGDVILIATPVSYSIDGHEFEAREK
jgi:beta-lactamase superfamily II metal-dependent hydrolase